MIALYLLTDPKDEGARVVRVIEAAISAAPGYVAVVVRHMDVALALEIQALCVEQSAPCFIKAAPGAMFFPSSRPHVAALKEGHTAPSCPFTASAHDVGEATRAKTAAAIFVSPIFDVPAKMKQKKGTGLITEVRDALPAARLYALGGVHLARIASCVEAGADGVALIRAVMQAKDPGAATLELVAEVRRARTLLQ